MSIRSIIINCLKLFLLGLFLIVIPTISEDSKKLTNIDILIADVKIILHFFPIVYFWHWLISNDQIKNKSVVLLMVVGVVLYFSALLVFSERIPRIVILFLIYCLIYQNMKRKKSKKDDFLDENIEKQKKD